MANVRRCKKLRPLFRPARAARSVRNISCNGKTHDTRAIQDYLGHKNIEHTVRYTELSPTRFKNFWRHWLLMGLMQRWAANARYWG